MYTAKDRPKAVSCVALIAGLGSVIGNSSLVAAISQGLHKARRNTLCIKTSASRLRGHKQYTVHIPAMMRLAAIQPPRQNSTVCISPPSSALRLANQHANEEGQTWIVKVVHREM